MRYVLPLLRRQVSTVEIGEVRSDRLVESLGASLTQEQLLLVVLAQRIVVVLDRHLGTLKISYGQLTGTFHHDNAMLAIEKGQLRRFFALIDQIGRQFILLVLKWCPLLAPEASHWTGVLKLPLPNAVSMWQHRIVFTRVPSYLNLFLWPRKRAKVLPDAGLLLNPHGFCKLLVDCIAILLVALNLMDH